MMNERKYEVPNILKKPGLGLEKSVWGKRLIEAERAGACSGRMHEDASQWSTCACGEAGVTDTTPDSLGPRDNLLRSYGLDFSQHIRFAREQSANLAARRWHIEEAAKLLVRIHGYSNP